MAALPPNDTQAENQFLERLAELDADEILGVVLDAVAARAVGLLPPGYGADEPAVERARRAGRMMLLAPVDRRGPIIEELEAAAALLQGSWMARARQRQRQLIKDPHQRSSPERRKPRLPGRGRR